MPYLKVAQKRVPENFAFQEYKFRKCAITSTKGNKVLTWNCNYLTSLLYNIKYFLHKFINKIPEKQMYVYEIAL
jgi:hypothetical protein